MEVTLPVRARLKDRLAMLPCLDAVDAAYKAVSAIQELPPAQQVAGAALLLRTFCEMAGLDLSEVLHQASRMAHDAQQDGFRRRELSALRDYVKGEIAG